MHTAVRSKVPLKKKVRGERSKKKPLPAIPQLQLHSQKDGGLTTSNTLVIPNVIKPSSRSQKKSLESPRKLLRKKKKRSSSDENSKDEQQQQMPVKPSRKPKKKATSSSSKHKEIIDYSNPESHTNTFGKVQKWLLESPIVLSAASQIEYASKMSNMMNKSHSTPEHLAIGQNTASMPQPQQPQPQAQQQQQQRAKNNKSTSNINDKVRLQVVYKPPFKFSLKFSKNENNVKTNVITNNNSNSNNNNSNENKSRRQQMLQQQISNNKRNSLDDPARSRRAALLIRSATEEINNKITGNIEEPLYETLSHPPKRSMPNYENLPTTSSTANLMDATLNNSITSPIINTATFRVNKSASGSNINNHRNLPVVSTPVLKKDLRRSSIGNSGSSGNLMKFGGSSQNLTRSSTTNLTEHRSDGVKRHSSDMNRSSTTNLNKYHRQHSSQSNSSNSNLRRGGSHMDVNASPSSEDYTPMSSSERQKSKNASRKNSSSCMAVSGSSRRESFNNNIPRASLMLNSSSSSQQHQYPRPMKPINATQPLSSQSRLMIDELNKNRPQTSSCDSSMFKNFEWPKVLTTQRSLPADNNGLQSDLEVMVSDVENLVNDS